MTRPDPQRRTPRGAPLRWRGALVAVVAVAAGAAVFTGSTSTAPGGAVRAGTLAEVPVTAMDLNVGFANNSPQFAVDPTEPQFVVLASRLDAPDFGCALHVSGDRGRSWLPARPIARLPEGAEKCYAPEVAFGPRGTLHYLFVGLAGRGNEPMGAFLTSSSDRGRTFTAPQRILGPLNFAVRMAIDPAVGEHGRMHLVWIRATSDPPLGGFGPPPNPIMAAHSDDGGQSFSPPVQVNGAGRELVVAPALALGPDGAVHVAYYDLEGDAVDYHGVEGPTWQGTWSLVAATSLDRGRSFGDGVVVDDAVTPHERVMLVFTMPPPAFAADRRGRLCAAWPDARFGDADILLRCSSEDAPGWGPLRRVNDDAVGGGASQYMPQLAVAPGGRLDAVFYDRRDDPDDVRTHVYYAYSTDGGRSFSPNLRLTSDWSNPRIGQRYTNPSAEGMVELGSRLGLVSGDGDVLAAWTDTRNSGPGTSQDVFATTVRFAPRSPAGGDDA